MKRTRHYSAAVLLAAASLAVSNATAQTFTNPIVRDSADPWVVQFKGQYFHTRAGVFGLTTVERSPALHTLGSPARSDIIWAPPSGQPYSSGLWAPETHYLDGKWYLYVAGDDGNNSNHRMYVLEGNSQDPGGTYEFRGKIAATTDRWAIDGTVLEHAGQRYFVWSGWPGAANVRQDLYIARMTSPTTISGERVLISSPEYTWEKRTGGIVAQGINEAPQVLQRDGKTFIIYSASLFADQQYCLGQLELTGNDPMVRASWTKKATPVFSRTADVAGPGHPSFVKSPDGTQDWIVYHAHNNPTAFDERRNVHAQTFTWNADGTPNFGAPISPSTAINIPSGRIVSTFIANCGFDRADVRSPSSAGTASGVEQMGNRGVVGVIDNRGRFFNPIAGGDGAQCGFINAVGDNGVFYDAGQIFEAGTYSFSAGFAISSDQALLASLGSGSFKLVLESVGRDVSGNPIESDKVTLGQLSVNSSAWNSSRFTYFAADGTVPLAGARLDSLLRVGVYSELGNLVNWSAKIDKLNLNFVPIVGWQRDAGGNWSDQSNWSGGVPHGKGAVAKFTSAITSPRTITLDSPRTVGSITFDNASAYTIAGAALTLETAGGAANVNVARGSHTISAPTTFASDTEINVADGALVLTGNVSVAAGRTISKSGGGEVTMTSVRASGLSVSAGVVRVSASGGVSDIGAISIIGGQLDLTDNDLIVRATPAGSWDGSSYTGVSGMVASGYNGGEWSGNGIVTSTPDAAIGLKSLAVAGAAELLSLSPGQTATWRGQSVAADAVLVMYTWGGDADLDGDLDGDDYFCIDSNIASSGSVFGYTRGDFDYNGAIDGDDYFIIDSNIAFAHSGGGEALATVPEPHLAALSIALTATVRRRRQ